MRIPWTLHEMPLPQVTEVVCNYFAFECGVRNLAPVSIKAVYIPGVVNLFTLNRLPSAAILPRRRLGRLGDDDLQRL